MIELLTSLLTGHEIHSQYAIIFDILGGIGSAVGGILGGNA